MIDRWRVAVQGPGRRPRRPRPAALLLRGLLLPGLLILGLPLATAPRHSGPSLRPVAVDSALDGMPAGTTNTEFGPLTPADRDFLVKVRQAGLWEGPAGQLAQFRSANPLVRDAGIHLVSGHAELDAKVLAVGAALGVELPSSASAAQKGWVAEMRDAPTPQAFDRVFADRLRAAHGKVYALLSHIRTGTRNTVIRTFAQRSMEVVLDHITVLERTGAVDFAALPLPVQPAVFGDGPPVLTQTTSGPMTPAGRDLLVKVRLAGLWEGPSGRQAQQRAASPLVKEAGRHLIEGHAALDAEVLVLGRRFGVALPTEPNEDQLAWMAEMTAAPTAQDYDRVFVARLRAAHGKVYTLLADIRTGTRNAEIRAFADRAMTVVLDHISVLERTGLVDFAALPLPPEPAPAPARGGPGGNLTLYLVLGMVAVGGLVAIAARREFNGLGT